MQDQLSQLGAESTDNGLNSSFRCVVPSKIPRLGTAGVRLNVGPFLEVAFRVGSGRNASGSICTGHNI